MKENSREKDEEILNNIKSYMQESIDNGYHKFIYNNLGYDEKCVDVINAIEHILSDYKRVLKENEELKSDNLEYQRIQDIFDKRTYRKKYLEERRKEEPNLLYPDTDEIYRRYYELKKENQQLRNEYRNIQQDAYIQGRAEEQQKAEQIIYENYISKQIIKSKIEEIGEKIKYEENEKAVIYLHKQKNILQELLESEDKL